MPNCDLCDRQFHPSCIETLVKELLEKGYVTGKCTLPPQATLLLGHVAEWRNSTRFVGN